jgi:hypothetical protein
MSRFSFLVNHITLTTQDPKKRLGNRHEIFTHLLQVAYRNTI